ncbi:MAG: DUF389 domain-containing protein [Bacteroidota bacterium]
MWTELRKLFHSIVNLRETTDTKGTIDSIRQSTAIKGYNVWILACGAMLASIGLDMNSVAVIIGAMLISPLMSPILGIGLAFGINDRKHLFLALENFAVAVVASLGVSYLYFSLTPFNGAPGPEIVNRTMPTLLDVFIALFGGTAGIVAVSRKDKTNAIPGVAIATALMPPICVAGYGLAKANWGIFLGAFYLFFINAVFIAASTYVIVRYLRFPYTEYPEAAERRKALGGIITFAILLIVPSIYFFYTVINRVQMENNITNFIEEQVNTENHKVSNSEIDQKDSVQKLILYIAGAPISKDSMAYLSQKKDDYKLEKLDLKFLQVSLSEAELADRSTQNAIKAIDPRIVQLEKEIDSVREEILKINETKGPEFSQLQKRAKALFPDLTSFTLADQAFVSEMNQEIDTICMAVTEWNKKLRLSQIKQENQKIADWLKELMPVDSVRVVSP